MLRRITMSAKRFGIMLDMSRNHVMKIGKLKEYTSIIKKFGYNTIMLYTEDTYEVKNEPYFGYMRGSYTVNELKEYDAFCKENGIELIPCIQTLAHLNAIFRWSEYQQIKDTNDILLCGEERTYQLIENIFSTLEKAFTSRLVHIGMDEAEMMALGKYLQKNGYVNRFSVLNEHLNKVMEIAKKHGFSPIIWSDMFFKLGNNGEYYLPPDGKFNVEEAIKYIPVGLGLVFWDYYHSDKKIYDNMIKAHKQLSDNVWFAGGAWTWAGFAPFNKLTLKNMTPAMKSCAQYNVDNIFITCWGDNGAECSPFGVLPSLFYIKKIYDGERSIAKIKREFFDLTGEKFDSLMALDLPNDICGNKASVVNPCKYVLYNDLFNGYIDSSLPLGGNEDYKRYAKKLNKLAKGSKFYYLFNTLSQLCSVLSEKYDLGIKIRSAYKKNDIEELKVCIKNIDTVIKKLDKFYYAFRKQWYLENKPHGFDVQDLRLGGLERRLKTCRETLIEYVNGGVENISELEIELLDLFGGGEQIKKELACLNIWTETVSVNTI